MRAIVRVVDALIFSVHTQMVNCQKTVHALTANNVNRVGAMSLNAQISSPMDSCVGQVHHAFQAFVNFNVGGDVVRGNFGNVVA